LCEFDEKHFAPAVNTFQVFNATGELFTIFFTFDMSPGEIFTFAPRAISGTHDFAVSEGCELET
jgi:hypothetical protein